MGVESNDNRKLIELFLAPLTTSTRLFDEMMAMATSWIGKAPALPSFELWQVQGHLLNITMLLFNGDFEGASLESAKLQKHQELVMFDIAATVNKFHFDLLRAMSKDFRQRTASALDQIDRELDRLDALQKGLEPPPSEQRGNLKDIEADRLAIEYLNLRQLQIGRDLELLYQIFQTNFGSAVLKEFVDRFRALG